MIIVGQTGDDRYLVEVEPRADGVRMGRVLDLEQKRLFPPWPLDSLLARGYWEACTGSQDRLSMLLEKVE